MLILYDTTNYVDHPIGGQLTSVRSFLRFLSEEMPEMARCVLLVGVTTEPNLVGVESSVNVSGIDMRFLPVAHADTDLAHVRGSLRMRFAKGLLKYLPKIGLKKADVNFIHTPEAFGPIKLLGRGSCVVMSHGSFLNMKDNLRFYKKSWLASAFQRYLIWVIKRADRLLVLDKKTKDDYSKLNDDVRLVLNSIEYRENVSRNFNASSIKLLFVGRLSAVKNIGPIIEAAEQMPEVSSLTIVGDGEEHERLKGISGSKIVFLGSLETNLVREQMRRADILVMNSIHEGVPMTILEAMGVGLPVVTTNVGGIGEFLKDGDTCLFTDGTSQSIVKSIGWVLEHYEQVSSSLFEESNKFFYSNVNAEIVEHIATLSR